jgi:hypothetical protein
MTIGGALAVKIENRIGLVNGIAVSIHQAVRWRAILPVAFILDERAASWLTAGEHGVAARERDRRGAVPA